MSRIAPVRAASCVAPIPQGRVVPEPAAHPEQRRPKPLESTVTAVNTPAELFHTLNTRLDELLDSAGRSRADVIRSLMTRVIVGRDAEQLRERLDGRDATVLREQGVVIGTPSAVEDQLGQLAEVGVERVMLQWMELDDLAGLELLAERLLGVPA